MYLYINNSNYILIILEITRFSIAQWQFIFNLFFSDMKTMARRSEKNNTCLFPKYILMQHHLVFVNMKYFFVLHQLFFVDMKYYFVQHQHIFVETKLLFVQRQIFLSYAIFPGDFPMADALNFKISFQ